MKLTAAQALELARWFRQIANALGDYRLNNWNALTQAQRQRIDNAEWSLINYSSDLTTEAVGTILDDAEGSLERIQEATNKANKIIQKIQDVKKAIGIATAFVGLGAAIITGNTSAITTALKDLFNAINA